MIHTFLNSDDPPKVPQTPRPTTKSTRRPKPSTPLPTPYVPGSRTEATVRQTTKGTTVASPVNNPDSIDVLPIAFAVVCGVLVVLLLVLFAVLWFCRRNSAV